MNNSIIFTTGIILVIIVIIPVVLLFITYKRTKPNTAILRIGMGGTRVSFDGLIVLPFIHKHYYIDLSIKQFESRFLQKDALRTRSGEIVEIIVTSYWCVCRNFNDIINVQQIIGAENSKSVEYIQEHFNPKVLEAVNTVVNYSTFENLKDNTNMFKQHIFENIGNDLNGYLLDDLSIQLFRKIGN